MDKLLDAFIQSVFTTGLISTVAYFVQRHHKNQDAYKIERQKALLAKNIDVEQQIYEVIKQANNQIVPVQLVLVGFSNQINTLRQQYYLYISDAIYTTSGDYADYLLQVAADPAAKSIDKEKDFAKKFRTQFRS